MKMSIADLAENCFPEEIMIGSEEAALTARVKERVFAEIEAERNGEKSAGYRSHLRPKRWLSLALAAALLLSLGLAAYAISSIHQARQQKLRSELSIDESHTESYVEYEVPSEDTQGLILLSAIHDGSFQKVYVNVSPVTKEQIERYGESVFFMWQLTDGHGNGRDEYGMAGPSLAPDRSVHERDEILEAVRQDAYDAKTKTLTLSLQIHSSMIRDLRDSAQTDSATLTVWLWEPEEQKKAGIDSLGEWLHSQQSFGSVSFYPTESEFVSFPLGSTLVTDSETGREIELSSLDLGPTSAVFRLRYENMGPINTEQDQEELTAWGNAESRVISRIRLRFSDGSVFSVPGFLADPYENGTVNCFVGWEKAIDIHGVVQITLDDIVLWEENKP